MSKTEITAEPGTSQILITREFDAPRELVFRAYTEPDLIVRWLGLRGSTVRIDEYDVRNGGRWRYVETDQQGNEHGFRGVFHGEPSPDGSVRTFEYEGVPGHVALETLTMTEHDGRTLVSAVSSFQSVEDRDAMVASGMEYGVHQVHEHLAELLADLQGEGRKG